MQKVKESSWFWAPVRAEDAPGYHDVVARPMDLATISDRLKRGGPEQGGYSAATDFLADMQLVWENCRAVSEPKGPRTGACWCAVAAGRPAGLATAAVRVGEGGG